MPQHPGSQHAISRQIRKAKKEGNAQNKTGAKNSNASGKSKRRK